MSVAGMVRTSRRVQGPGFELVGLTGAQGVHTAIVVPDASARRAALDVADGVRAFLEQPGITGLARLVGVDESLGGLVFATGEVWSVAEVFASIRRRGHAPGPRAGLELAWQVAELLSRAHAESVSLGARCHGAIDPWRLALRVDGQVAVLGYGVCPGAVGLSCTGAARAEALRYAPPERVNGDREDATSDLFSLALVALEWVVGEPVYAGDEDVLLASARDADGDRVLWGWRDRVPSGIASVLGRALRRDADARWPDARSFAAALRQELGAPGLEGNTLAAWMATARDSTERFVPLDEERGDDDRNRVVEADAPSAAPAVPSRARIVSLGGRRGRVLRPELPPAPELSAPPSPLAAESVAPVPAPPPTLEPVVVAPAVEPAEEVAAPDGTPQHTLDDADLVAPAGEGAQTAWDEFGDVGLTVALPDGGSCTVQVSGRARAGAVARRVAEEAGLPRLDALGRVSRVWELRVADAPVPDVRLAGTLGRVSLSLASERCRALVLRVRGARGGVTEAQVSTGLTAAEAAAALAPVAGHVTGRTLLVDGVTLPADAAVHGTVREGAVVEVVP